MPVHDVAQRGFDAGADAYDRARPSYPPDAVAWLIDTLRIEPGRRVCELAAGTGKLTRLLAPTGADIVAVEPVEACGACWSRRSRASASRPGRRRPFPSVTGPSTPSPSRRRSTGSTPTGRSPSSLGSCTRGVASAWCGTRV